MSLAAIEVQVISRILTSSDPAEVEKLCEFDETYYKVYENEIKFILSHLEEYHNVPDPFTFQAQFEDFEILDVSEPLEYLENSLRRNKQHKLLIETFNMLKTLGSGDVSDAWEYLKRQCDYAESLETLKPMDIIKDAQERADQVLEFSKQQRIPTGFKEIDQCMYGGLSTVEEFLVIVARTNSGKSWVCTKLMETAQDNGFPVLFYSPEMQSSFIGTRFDTWRGHFRNSELHGGKYSDEYNEYIKELPKESTSAIVVEDSDMSEGKTTVHGLELLVKRHGIKLLIIDGLSYIATSGKYSMETNRYKDICTELFNLSKRHGCAVAVAIQANRETRENRDENGEPFPSLYNVAESDHPARIATQVFSLRQIYEQNIIELRLEKSRNARNQKPIFAYTVDFNTGNLEFASSPTESIDGEDFQTPMVSTTIGDFDEVESEVVPYDDDFDDIQF